MSGSRESHKLYVINHAYAKGGERVDVLKVTVKGKDGKVGEQAISLSSDSRRRPGLLLAACSPCSSQKRAPQSNPPWPADCFIHRSTPQGRFWPGWEHLRSGAVHMAVQFNPC